jgi:hypothetical protein
MTMKQGLLFSPILRELRTILPIQMMEPSVPLQIRRTEAGIPSVDVKTSRDDKGWYLEMRIPFSGLKFKAENGVTIMDSLLKEI